MNQNEEGLLLMHMLFTMSEAQGWRQDYCMDTIQSLLRKGTDPNGSIAFHFPTADMSTPPHIFAHPTTHPAFSISSPFGWRQEGNWTPWKLVLSFITVKTHNMIRVRNSVLSAIEGLILAGANVHATRCLRTKDCLGNKCSGLLIMEQQSAMELRLDQETHAGSLRSAENQEPYQRIKNLMEQRGAKCREWAGSHLIMGPPEDPGFVFGEPVQMHNS